MKLSLIAWSALLTQLAVAADYPTLKPAFTIILEVGTAIPIGSFSRNTPLTDGPIVNGTMKSAPGFEPAINAKLVGVGNDYFHADPDGKRTRLDAQGVFQNVRNATENIYFHYTGYLTFTPELLAILNGDPNAKTTPFGVSFLEQRFETGVARWAEFERNVFVAGGRFLVDGSGKSKIEYRYSQVTWTQ